MLRCSFMPVHHTFCRLILEEINRVVQNKTIVCVRCNERKDTSIDILLAVTSIPSSHDKTNASAGEHRLFDQLKRMAPGLDKRDYKDRNDMWYVSRLKCDVEILQVLQPVEDIAMSVGLTGTLVI